MNKAYFYTAWASAVLSIPIAGLMAFGNAGLNPASLYVGLPLSAMYLAVFLLAFRWAKLDWKPITVAFLWGAGITFAFVLSSGEGPTNLPLQLGVKQFTASFAGGFPEELGKSLGILIILLGFQQLSRPWHGFIVGTFVGLGFTIAENIGYGAMGGMLHATSDVFGVAHIWGLRTALGPAQHAVYSGIIGFGIAYALFKPTGSKWNRIGVAAAWWFLGFMLHFIWNASWETYWYHAVSLTLAAGVAYPLYIWLYVKLREAALEEQTDSPTPPIPTADTAA